MILLRQIEQTAMRRIAVLLLLAWISGYLMGRSKPNEVICHDPVWQETGFAVASAQCDGNVQVHWVD